MMRLKPLTQDLWGKIQCPRCKVIAEVSKEIWDIENSETKTFIKHHKVEEMLEEQELAIDCEFCEKAGKVNSLKAEYWCFTCKLLLCTECRAMHRYLQGKDMKHRIRKFKNPRLSQSHLLCLLHKDQPTNLYCYKCKESICIKCISKTDKHVGHKTT